MRSPKQISIHVFVLLCVSLAGFLVVHKITQAPWGSADIDRTIAAEVDQIARDHALPRIVLGQRFASKNFWHAGTWRGHFDYAAVVGGNPKDIRIFWQKTKDQNNVIRIAELKGTAVGSQIWASAPP